MSKYTDALAKLGISITSEFVPQSQSRTPETRCLNWKVTLRYNDRRVTTTDYTAGMAHCPAYSKLTGPRTTIHNDNILKVECETGRAFTASTRRGQPIEPDTASVVASLVLDSNVLDHRNFEDWAENYGYDTDSRKAEAIYQACLKIGLEVRAGLGEAMLTQLRDLFQDF